MLAKNKNHESFDVKNEGKDRLHVVRQDRHEVRGLSCNFKTRLGDFEVMNYSSFGLAILVPSGVKFSDGLEGELIFEGHYIGSISTRLARQEELPNGLIKVGLEILGEPLNMARVQALGDTLQIVAENMMELGTQNEIPEKFRLRVFETRDLLEKLERELEELYSRLEFTRQADVTVFERAAAEVVTGHLLKVFSGSFEDLAKILTELSPDQHKACLEFFRSKLRHLIYQAPFADRAYSKPLGYAGDFEMMSQLYRNEPLGKTLFSKCLNHYFLNHPYSQAVRNRSEFLAGKILNLKEKAAGKKVQVLSVACGPARELQLLLNKGVDLSNFEFHLMDQDLSALREAQRELKLLTMGKKDVPVIHYFHKAIKNLLTEKSSEQYDLIYSAGLFDYFSDNVARMAGKKLFKMSRPEAKIIIGNYKAFASGRMQMELVLDWHLIYRSEEDLKALFSQVSPNVTVESEPEGVNLFVEITK